MTAAGGNDFATMAASSMPSVSGGWNFYSNAGAAPSGTTPGVSTSADPLNMTQTMAGIDLHRLQQLSASLQAPAAASTTGASNNNGSNNRFTSVQEMIQTRREGIINDLIVRTMTNTRARCDQMHANRMRKQWEEQKAIYLKELQGESPSTASSTKYTTLTPSAPSSNTKDHDTAHHVRLIQEWTQNPEMPILYELDRLASKSPAYSAAWKLVHALQRKYTPLERALATLSHLGRQFQGHVATRVRSGPPVSSPTLQMYTGMARTIASHVHLTVGSQASYWAIVYYCLRCGDFGSALQVLQVHDKHHELVEPLQGFAKQQGTHPFLWEQVSSIHANAGGIIFQSFQNVFEEACWKLLMGRESLAASSPLVKTIEDFCYLSLWYAILGAPDAEKALVELGQNIVDLGPRHFDGDDWAYVTPLLLTQRYNTALTHLVKGERGILQATHLALFLPSLTDVGSDQDSSSRDLLTSLLVTFATNLQTTSASSALEYLARIPDAKFGRTKIVELICTTRQFEELGGTLSQDGVRREGALDRHFSAKQVCDVLEEAALWTNSQQNTKDALELLNLAERYDSLLMLLNDKLASLLQSNAGAEREFWLKASKDFDSWHFGGRRTHAIKVLEARDKVALVDVFHTLLKLFTFFDRVMMHDFKEATSIVDGLGLFPQSHNEVTAKANSYIIMDPVLKEVFSSIILAAMDSLYQQFVRSKYSGIVSDTSREHLEEMKKRASLLASFANALELPLDVRSRMANMEAQMV